MLRYPKETSLGIYINKTLLGVTGALAAYICNIIVSLLRSQKMIRMHKTT